ncbi:hypothetical protein [Frigoribacterium sp. UYMn621]|uniref:hypothetical protein n=1 Tax=Frigoribacterium sp. UYMn621 TaxID=3156343 RepID=UPI0033950998
MGRIETQIYGFRETALGILTEIVKEAEAGQILALNLAVTDTGKARIEAGGPGTSGRNDTGHMIDGISSEAHEEGDLLVGTWGWDNPEPYFIEQEYVNGRLGGAHSLATSMIGAKAKIRPRIQKALETF